MTQKITPFLWFDKDIDAVLTYYTSIFKDAKIIHKSQLPETPSGNVGMATLEIFGQQFSLMTAGPLFKFNESISFMVNCKDQAEIDYYWNALSADGGQEIECGWLKDKYGLCWQIVPENMGKMMSEGTLEQTARVTAAFMKMKKFDIKTLEEVYRG